MDARLKAILVRAAKTFAQAALAVVVASGTGYIDANVWKSALIAGGAALVSFAWNLLGGVPEA